MTNRLSWPGRVRRRTAGSRNREGAAMGETLIPLAEQEWRDPAVEHLGARPVEAPSLMTVIGLAEGEVLLHVEANGATPLRGLIRALPQPAPIVTMAIGSLIRKGVIRAGRWCSSG